MTERAPEIDKFVADLHAFIDERWPELRSVADDPCVDHDAAMTLEEMGQTYVSCWALSIGVASVEDADAQDLSVLYTARGQTNWTTRGLVEECIDYLR